MRKDKKPKTLYHCPECQEDVPTVYYKNGKWLCFDCFEQIKAKNEENKDK